MIPLAFDDAIFEGRFPGFETPENVARVRRHVRLEPGHGHRVFRQIDLRKRVVRKSSRCQVRKADLCNKIKYKFKLSILASILNQSRLFDIEVLLLICSEGMQQLLLL